MQGNRSVLPLKENFSVELQMVKECHSPPYLPRGTQVSTNKTKKMSWRHLFGTATQGTSSGISVLTEAKGICAVVRKVRVVRIKVNGQSNLYMSNESYWVILKAPFYVGILNLRKSFWSIKFLCKTNVLFLREGNVHWYLETRPKHMCPSCTLRSTKVFNCYVKGFDSTRRWITRPE